MVSVKQMSVIRLKINETIIIKKVLIGLPPLPVQIGSHGIIIPKGVNVSRC